MHAIVVKNPGGAEALEFGEYSSPVPGPGQLLVQVAAAGVNFIDIYQRSGQYAMDLPFVPGMEGSGTVLACEPTSGFAVGQRVAWAMAPGSYTEQAVIPAHAAVPVPDSVALDVAAAAMLQGMTAHFLANSVVSLESGDVVVVHAGAGGVGLLVTQMLSRIGVRVITTTSTPEKAALSMAAGAARTTSYEDFVDVARSYTGGDGVHAVFDGVGASTFLKGFDALRPRGTMVLFGQASGPVGAFDPQLLNAKGSIYLTRPSLGHYIAARDELLWRAEAVFALIGEGALEIRIGASYPLAEAARAHDDLASRRTTGKLLLIA